MEAMCLTIAPESVRWRTLHRFFWSAAFIARVSDQATLLPECLDDYIAEDNPVRAFDAFVEELDLGQLGFAGADPAVTGRPAYHPAVRLKLYIYGYLNRVPSSRRLEREAQRNVELMWLTGRLAPDFKTIAEFRRDNGAGIRVVCRRFVQLCRVLKLFTQAIVASNRSKRASGATWTPWKPPTAPSRWKWKPRPNGWARRSRPCGNRRAGWTPSASS